MFNLREAFYENLKALSRPSSGSPDYRLHMCNKETRRKCLISTLNFPMEMVAVPCHLPKNTDIKAEMLNCVLRTIDQIKKDQPMFVCGVHLVLPDPVVTHNGLLTHDVLIWCLYNSVLPRKMQADDDNSP